MNIIHTRPPASNVNRWAAQRDNALVIMEQTSAMLLDKYLAPSPLSDCDNPGLKRAAMEIVKGVGAPTEAAPQVFKYVRDEIAFNATLDIYLRASEALKRKTLDYCNKVNIHVNRLKLHPNFIIVLNLFNTGPGDYHSYAITRFIRNIS